MTNAQKWVSIFLFLFVALLVLSKLTNKNDDEADNYIDEYSSTQTEPLSGAEALISNNKCLDCHGPNLKGSASAPSLQTLSEEWKREDLLNYLKNPRSFADDPRISKFKGKYRLAMPPVDKLNDEELNTLVNHLLSIY